MAGLCNIFGDAFWERVRALMPTPSEFFLGVDNVFRNFFCCFGLKDY